MMWSKALTWKRDKTRQEAIARQQAIESSNRYKILSAAKQADHSAASKIANQLLEYYLKNKQSFHALDKEGLFKSGDDSGGVFLLIHEGEVEFYARYKAILDPELLPDRTMQEVEFYRLGSSFYTLYISKRVLFDYLLPTHKTIVTNTHLTYYEKRIWIEAHAFALDSPEKYSVFLLDMQNIEQKTVQITSKRQLGCLEDRYWSTEDTEQTFKIAITMNLQ